MIIIVYCIGCNKTPDKEHLKKEILQIHNNFKKEELERDSEFFIQGLSENFISIKNRNIFSKNLDEIKEGITDYINNTS